MTISQPSRYTPAQTTGETLTAQAAGLTDEHGQLLRQIAVRAEALLAGAAAGGWPAGELQALLGYFSTEVLRQVADEEAFLFAARAGSGVGRLARDHARLRSGIEALQRAADGGSPEGLASLTRDVLCQLGRRRRGGHPGRPGGTGSTPATAALSRRPHE